MKPKSKKSAKPSSEPTPIPAPSPSISFTVPISSFHVHAALTIPTSTVPPLPKPTTHSLEPTAKNTSKSTKVKATQRKSIKKVPDTATQVGIVVKESVIQGESVPVNANQVQHTPLKLDILVSAIDVAPLDTLPPTSEKPQVEELTIEKGVGDPRKETEDEEDDGGEKEEEDVDSQEEHNAEDIANEEEKSENEGASGNKKESDTDDKIGEQVNDSAEEENHSKEEDNSESEGRDQEKVSESEGVDEESEKENQNLSEEYEGSMTIGNTVIAHSEATGEETRAQEPGSLLTPFTRDEEVSSDEDNLPLSEVGKKPRKTSVKATKLAVPTRKGVAPPARTPLIRSKRNVVDEQVII
ncbi:uncharacterized protein [Nicotiana tomentosiformis]|uniref:uncharacterized protein n=1 Tax=Nicotiana tomentosiformis TaxID=4098 RepID=UPI00051B50A4|nr:cyclic nucleotide-gated cation channel beta-1-like [Nicotiana tomentosiformis]